MQRKDVKEIHDYEKYCVDIETIRKEKNISKNALCKMTNISFSGLQPYCRSEIQRVDLDVISRICKALDCEISDVIKKSDS